MENMWKKSMAWILSLALLVGSIGTFAFFSLAEDGEAPTYAKLDFSTGKPVATNATQRFNHAGAEVARPDKSSGCFWVQMPDGEYACWYPSNNRGFGMLLNEGLFEKGEALSILVEYYLPKETLVGDDTPDEIKNDPDGKGKPIVAATDNTRWAAQYPYGKGEGADYVVADKPTNLLQSSTLRHTPSGVMVAAPADAWNIAVINLEPDVDFSTDKRNLNFIKWGAGQEADGWFIRSAMVVKTEDVTDRVASDYDYIDFTKRQVVTDFYPEYTESATSGMIYTVQPLTAADWQKAALTENGLDAGRRNFLYFKVSDSMLGVGDIRVNVHLAKSAEEDFSGSIALEYQTSDPDASNKNYKTLNQPAAEVVTFEMTDAAFANGQHAAGSFRLNANGRVIKCVEVFKKSDRTALDAAIADEVTDLSKYTEETVATYIAALDAAKAVTDPFARQSVVDAATKALTDAKAGLELIPPEVIKNVAKVDLLDPANNVNATITKNDLTKKVTVAGKEANWYGTAHNDRPIEFTFDTSVFPNVDENPDVDGVQSNLMLKVEYYLPGETAGAIMEANEGLTIADCAKATLAFRRPHWNSIDNKVDGGTGKEPALNQSIGGAGAAFTPVVFDQWAVAYIPMDNTMLANGNYFHVCFYNGNADKTVGYFLRSLTLVKEADKTELAAAVENAKEDLSGYTEETVAVYAEALAAAKAVLAKDGATEEDVATALKNLQDADAALVEDVPADYSSAEVDYSTGEVVLKNMTVSGNHIPGGENVTTPVEIGGSNGLKLQNTNANMCLKIDPNVLAENDSNVTIRVEYYLPEESTDGSQMRPYYFSVEDAKKYGDWKKASDATLVKGEWATTEWQLTDAKFLRKAENGNGQMDGGSDLMLIFNTNTPGDCIYIRKITVTKTAAPDPKDALREMVAAEIKDLSAYTADSAKAYTDAMNAAKAVLDNEEATEADIQKAIDDLTAAIKGLTAAKAPEVIVLETMDNATDFNSGTLDTTNKKQGAGAIFATSEGGKEALIARKNATLDIALPQGWADTYYLEAWFYVSDVDALPGSSWIEISQQQDQIEAQFNVGTLTGLQDGWNKIQIKIRDMSLSKIEQMEKVAQLRFFCTPTDALTVGFDDIVLTPYAGAANDSDYGKQQVADLAEAVAKAEKVDTKDVPKALTDALDAAIAAAKAVNGEEATVRDVMVLAETLAAAQKAVEDYEAPTQPTTEPTVTETEPSVTETEPSETETEPSATETEPSETEPEPSEEETEPSNEEPAETAAPTTEALPGETETGEASAVLPVALLAVAAAAVSAVVLKKKEQK